MKFKEEIKKLKYFLILWSTQSLSQLGSSMTAFALTLWLYEKTGSALNTAALSICSYTPYVLMSIFAGALTDRFDRKKTMLICDTFAAVCTVAVLLLFRSRNLQVWHLYLINAVLGLMNTVQNPASEVSLTLIVPKELYQRTSGLQSLSRSLISILNPIIATAVYSLLGLTAVLIVDLSTFSVAFLALLFFELQGRVYACRNSLQYFTIPIGLFLGGLVIDEAAEPFMARFTGGTLMNTLFGTGKGSGAALMFFILGVAGVVMCLLFGTVLKKYKYVEDDPK